MSQENDTTVSRRDFLKLAWGAVGALAVVEAGGIALAFFLPRVAEGEFGGVVTAGEVDEFPARSVTPFNAGRFFLARLPDGGFMAIYRKCTHLGCAVPWDPVSGQFICPCHGATFTEDGTVTGGPAPRPLDIFPVIIEDNLVKVDTGSPIQRQTFDPSQVTYA